MWNALSQVIEQRQVSPYHFLTRICAPEIATSCHPGQFIQVRLRDRIHPLLPRPFSVMRRNEVEGTVEILYRIVGEGTRQLSEIRSGDRVLVWGPLGNSFPRTTGMQHIIVGGGVGIPPLLMLTEERLRSGQWSTSDLKVLLGARTSREVLCAIDFQSFGLGISVATDDGTWGYHGVVTRLLQMEVETSTSMFGPDQVCVYACGPYGMLKTVAIICQPFSVACQVCMEAPMPCGIGVCMGCVVPFRSERENGARYLRVCREGPVFDANEIQWEAE